jgi:hypothetical protein
MYFPKPACGAIASGGHQRQDWGTNRETKQVLLGGSLAFMRVSSRRVTNPTNWDALRNDGTFEGTFKTELQRTQTSCGLQPKS